MTGRSIGAGWTLWFGSMLATGCQAPEFESYRNEASIHMLAIAAGDFVMGDDAPVRASRPGDPPMHTDPKWKPYPRTRHRVTLDANFYISATEVTQAQWKAIMNINPPAFRGSDLPVEMVSFHDVQKFIQKLNTLVESGAFAPLLGASIAPEAIRSDGRDIDENLPGLIQYMTTQRGPAPSLRCPRPRPQP